MPKVAQRIVTAADLPYYGERYDSRATPSGGGSTVTLEGLKAVEQAVRILSGRSPLA